MRRMLAELKLSQRQAAHLVGRDAVTVNRYVGKAVIPATAADWIDQVLQIDLSPGRAVIVLGMPADTQTATYRRSPPENDKRRADGKIGEA